MLTLFSPDHRLHVSSGELLAGGFEPAWERPERADLIRDRIAARGLGPIEAPEAPRKADILRVHDAGLVDLVETGWEAWRAAGRAGDALPFTWRARGMRDDHRPTSIDGRLTYHAFDAGTPLTRTTGQAAFASAAAAATAARRLAAGEASVFALCRPPGHHASRDQYGGYCFLNNAAIGAEVLKAEGAGRIAILDIDYHHGNGTQQIFEARADVLYASIHGDPDYEFPFLSGWADETGTGPGEGFTLNLPLPAGSAFDAWGGALDRALARIADFGPDALVVSLGVDAYREDPISQFRLETADFLRVGERIARIRAPVLFVMEGGYALEAIAENAVNVLEGWIGA